MKDVTVAPKRAGHRSATLWFVFLCFVVLAGAMLSGASGFLNSKEGFFFDEFSDNLMKGDVRYMREYGLDGPFPRYLGPDMEFSRHREFTGGSHVTQYLESGNGIGAEEYVYYTSNLCVQRYFYALASLVWGGSIGGLFTALAVTNTLLLAAALAGVLCWLRGVTSTPAAAMVLLLLAFASPILLDFAQNLYWAPFTWFVPLLGAAFTVWRKPKMKTDAAWYRLLFVMSLLTCLYKQLYCFEFVSGVMVAMMLPYVCWLVQGVPLKQRKVWLKTLLWPTAGAAASFVVAMGAKAAVLALAWYPAKERGGGVWSLIIGNILQRTGGAETAAELAAEGYDVSLGGVLRVMFGDGAIVARSRLSISFGVLVAVLGVATVVALAWQAAHRWRDKKMTAVFTAAWVGFAAPMFWFVAGRLHVVDHIKIDLVVWYVPFVIVAYGALAYLVARLVGSAYKRIIKKEKPA